MKTLIIVSHPTVLESGSQQFLIQSLPDDEDITLHLLEETYPNGNIDVEKEAGTFARARSRPFFSFRFTGTLLPHF